MDAKHQKLIDNAIVDLREFIDNEERLIHEEHQLKTKLESMDYVIMHLAEHLPKEAEHLHALNEQLSEKLCEMRDYLGENNLDNITIAREEKRYLENLNLDLKHRDWQATHEDLGTEEDDEKRVVRLEQDALRHLHEKFRALKKIMKKSVLKKALKKDAKNTKEREAYEKEEEYYFLEIYRFVRTYENIFRHLIQKEKKIEKKLEKITEKIE